MTTTYTDHFRFGLPDFLSGPWHEDWHALVRKMDRALYEVVIAAGGTIWANSTAYTIGSIVISPIDGTHWVAAVAHTSSASPVTFDQYRAANPTHWDDFATTSADLVTFTPVGNLVATDVQAALAELDTEKADAAATTAALASKAPLASPALTGVPTAPTAAPGTNTTQVATTGFVEAAIDVILGGVASAFDTLSEIATELATKAPLTSPGFVTAANPSASDAASLGTTALPWSDIFFATGAVVNYGNGDVTITHSANGLAFAGASNGYTFDAVIKPSANDGFALGVSGTAFSDLFLASGGVINWNAGECTITHANASGVTFGWNAAAGRGVTFQNADSGGSSNINLTFSHGSGVLGQINVSSTGMIFGPTTAVAMSFANNGATRLQLTSGGDVTVRPDVATPAAGSTAARLLFGTTAGFGIYYGSGAPTVSAGQGSLYLRSDGSTTNNRIYVNANGGTTWTALTSVA